MRWVGDAMPQSLSARLFLAYVGAWLLIACVIGITILWFLRADPSHWQDHSTLSLAQKLATDARWRLKGGEAPAALPEEAEWLARAAPLDLGYRLIDAQGQVRLWSSPQVRQAWTEAGLAARPMSRQGRAVIDGLVLRMRTVPLDGPGEALWLELGLSERLIALLHAGNAKRLGGLIFGTVAVSILLLGAVQWLVLRRMMQPVRRLSAQAQELSFDRDSRLLDVRNAPLEIRPLVGSFNEALRRLEQAFARQLQFLADAAHELKTPLSLLRFQVELGQPDQKLLVRDIDQIARQVQQMLLLAEVTEPRSYRNEPIAISAVVGEVCELLGPMAKQHGVTIQFSPPPAGLELRGDSSALQLLLKNLVENAIGFAPRGTVVFIGADGQGLRVIDRGPGIEAAHLPHVFTRFWRAPSRRDSGAGLGLAICQAVARAHAWQLSVRNLEPGAEFALRFLTSNHREP